MADAARNSAAKPLVFQGEPAGPASGGTAGMGYVASMTGPAGILWVVATPIGNLGDLSPRAAETLRHADTVLAEDTRVTRRLLDAAGIGTPMESLHEHNERRAAGALVQRMLGGERMALVSDAGTPLLSDPGYLLVREAQEAGVAVRAVPGPSAVTAALSIAGLPPGRFWFEGFLPPRREARCQRLRELAALEGTLVFFEAPHRVRETLTDLVEVLGGEREAACAREISKRHEEVRRAPLAELHGQVHETSPRGEYVLMVAGAAAPRTSRDELERVLGCLLEELPTRRAAAVAARITRARRNEAYALALQLQGEDDGRR
jgi:16S rRNA (cytidine1402-2'-O)-methyltransferase